MRWVKRCVYGDGDKFVLGGDGKLLKELMRATDNKFLGMIEDVERPLIDEWYKSLSPNRGFLNECDKELRLNDGIECASGKDGLRTKGRFQL